MAGELTITVARVHLVRGDEDRLLTAPMGETGTAGQYFRLNTTTGYLEHGNATTTTELGNTYGILLDSVATANLTGTIALPGCILDLGDIFTSAAFDDPIYVSDTDSAIATSAGTVSRVVGRVVPGLANTTADKLMMVK